MDCYEASEEKDIMQLKDINLKTERNPIVVESEARRDLVGRTFQDVLKMGIRYLRVFHGHIDDDDAEMLFANVARKGGLGNLVEEAYFGYPANSDQGADLPASGVEVKATPYERRKNGNYVAGERLVITMISYKEAVEKNFYESHVWEKIKSILLIHYFREKEIKNNLLYRINYVNLFTPSEKDMAVIIEDYSIIIAKIEAGKAHELSEADTNYLGACTKGATAEKSWVFQEIYAPTIRAKKRAFCYKASYMTYVLNEYVLKRKPESEHIIKDVSLLKGTTFSQYVHGLVNKHIGKTDRQLCGEFNLPYSKNKAQWNTLAFRMLGIKSNRAEEFEKAGIVVKTIRVEENGGIREHMSLPPISLKVVGEEEWEESSLFDYFSESKFLLVVFKKSGEEYRLLGAKLWHMPFADLNGAVRAGWEETKKRINDGIIWSVEIQRNRVVVNNSLPGSSDNPIIHMRPHARKRYYRFEDGTILGDGTPSMAEELPDGRWMPKQSFWLNNSYLKKIVSDVGSN